MVFKNERSLFVKKETFMSAKVKEFFSYLKGIRLGIRYWVLVPDKLLGFLINLNVPLFKIELFYNLCAFVPLYLCASVPLYLNFYLFLYSGLGYILANPK